MLKDLILKAIDCIPSETECECCPMNLLTADRRNACLEVKSVAETLRRQERRINKPLNLAELVRTKSILEDERN
jgi:hypothetical protein